MTKTTSEKDLYNGANLFDENETKSVIPQKLVEKPYVSVIIPVYNGEDTIRRAVESVLAQTYENSIAIVVDDGSTDGTPAMLKRYESNNRVAIITTPNRGIGSARNTGLAYATSDFIKFLDSDDELKPDCLEKMVAYQQEYDADIVKCTFDSNVDNVIAKMKNKWVLRPVFSEKKDFITTIYPMFFTSLQMNNIWTLLIKRELLEGIKFNTSMITAEDMMFVLELVTKAQTMLLIPEPLYMYNQLTTSSVTRKNSVKSAIQKYECNKKISKKLLSLLPEWNMDTPMYRSLAKRRAFNSLLWKIDRAMYDKGQRKIREEEKERLNVWDKPVAPTWVESKLVEAMNGQTEEGDHPDWKTIKKLSNYYELRYLKMPGYNFVKRLLSFLISLCALIVLAIPMLLVVLLIYVEDGSPAIYRQRRLGRYGKPFTLYKFRSMPNNAEAKTGAVWASGDDNRATKIGRILRLTKIDELPQLINILKGEMSFVGPRPERPEFYDKFINKDGVKFFDQRLLVQPGLTGLAQITKGTNVTPEEKLELDLEYIKKRSIWFDTKMFFGTIIAVPKGKAK